MLKKKSSVYHAGQRKTDWIKVKKFEHFTLRVVGFQKTRGTKMKRGPFAIVELRDSSGTETTCKTKDDFELEHFELSWRRTVAAANNAGEEWAKPLERDPLSAPPAVIAKHHPAINRKLIIECGGRTRKGGYKGPVIWDRWESE